jgi:plastocyanin
VIRRPARQALQAAAAAALAGCAGAAPRPARHEIRIDAFVYHPASQAVNPGDTLVFVNHDAVPHTATANDASWDTGEILASAADTVVVPAGGIGEYKCAYHPNMKAALTQAR